jgi:hypothetical protein
MPAEDVVDGTFVGVDHRRADTGVCKHVGELLLAVAVVRARETGDDRRRRIGELCDRGADPFRDLGQRSRAVAIFRDGIGESRARLIDDARCRHATLLEQLRVRARVDRRLRREDHRRGSRLTRELAHHRLHARRYDALHEDRRFSGKRRIRQQHGERIARDVNEVGCVALDDDAQEAVERRELHVARRHRVVAVVIAQSRVGERQPYRFPRTMRAHEPFRIRAHRQAADSRIGDQDVHGHSASSSNRPVMRSIRIGTWRSLRS